MKHRGSYVSSSLSPLDHRRDVGCLTLLYPYFHSECASEIRDFMTTLRTFNRQTRFSRSVLQSHNVNMEHYLCECFPHEFNVASFKQNVQRFLSLFPLPPPNTLTPRTVRAGLASLRTRKRNKKRLAAIASLEFYFV